MFLHDTERSLKQRLTLPPIPAKADAVRSLANRLHKRHGLGEDASRTIAEAVTDPAEVRRELDERLTGMSGTMGRNLLVLNTRVWVPWVQRPADEVLRYAHKKRHPLSSAEIPNLASGIHEDSCGLMMTWDSPEARTWHLNDNRRLYRMDVYRPRLKFLAELGGITTPLVLLPQTECWRDEPNNIHSLRVIDGIQRILEVERTWSVYRDRHRSDYLPGLLGGKVKEDTFRKATARDRNALRTLVTAIHDKWQPIDPERYYDLDAVHYLTSVLTVPAVIIIGTADADTGEKRPLGHDSFRTARSAVSRWHSEDGGPKLFPFERVAYHGLLLSAHVVNEDMISTARQRLMAMQVPRPVIEFGFAPDTNPAARLVWWARATQMMGGSAETALAGFAAQEGRDWTHTNPEQLLAFARSVVNGDEYITYVPADYREPESRPDSLSFLTRDADAPFTHLVREDGEADMWAHPRVGNAHTLARAHMALHGRLPLDTTVGATLIHERAIVDWAQLARVVQAWKKDEDPGEFDVTTKEPQLTVRWMFPDDHKPPRPGVSHLFKLRHDVTLTIPYGPLAGSALADSELHGLGYVSAVVRRWFPDATGITFTDWEDRIITGVMVGSVWVKLFQPDPMEARERGAWYPEGRPAGTRDILEWDKPGSRVPWGHLLGAHAWPGTSQGGLILIDYVLEDMFQELDDEIVDQADDLLRETPPPVRDRSTPVPVLALKPLPQEGRR